MTFGIGDAGVVVAGTSTVDDSVVGVDAPQLAILKANSTISRVFKRLTTNFLDMFFSPYDRLKWVR
jgi:hypothetical protein